LFVLIKPKKRWLTFITEKEEGNWLEAFKGKKKKKRD